MAVACACSTSSGAPVTGRGSASDPKASMTTFHVRSDDDLEIPLLTAVAESEKSGAPTLTIDIAAGTYSKPLVLAAPTSPNKLGFVVTANNAVFKSTIQITGSSVSLRGLVVDGARPSGVAVSLQAFTTLEVANLALVGVRGSSTSEKDPIVDLVARAKGATAKLHDVWIVDSGTGAAPLVRIPQNGPGRWASVELANVAFVGNRGGSGIVATSTDALTIKHAFVVEPNLTEAWLHLDTHGAVTIDHATIAAKEVVEHGEAPKPTLTATQLTGLPKGSIDVAAAAAAARANTAPDRAKLAASYKLVP